MRNGSCPQAFHLQPYEFLPAPPDTSGSGLGQPSGGAWRGGAAHLHPGFGEVHPAGEVFPHESVGVVGPLEHALQGLQLAAVEGGPVPPLLSLLLLL